MATNKRKQQRFRDSQKKRYLDINRIEFVYDEGKDGIILFRRGVSDLSLDGKDYSQVRIAVNQKYYIRGMAMYGADRNFASGMDVVVYYANRNPIMKYRYGEQRLKRPVTTFSWHGRQVKLYVRKIMQALVATDLKRRYING